MIHINVDLSAAPHWLILAVCVTALVIELGRHHDDAPPHRPEPPEWDTGWARRCP